MRLRSVLLLLVCVLVPFSTFAQEPQKPEEIEKNEAAKLPETDGKLKTGVDDSGYGSNRLLNSERFPEQEKEGPVDRRQSIDAMTDHAIMAPNAFTPEQFTISLTSTNLIFNTLSFSPTDSIQTSLSLTVPTETTDFRVGASTKIAIIEDFSYLVSLQPFAEYHAGAADLDIMNFGLGFGVLADFYLSDRLVLGVAGHAFVNLVHGYDTIDFDTCQSRQDYLNGDCIDTSPEIGAFPAGGHWLALSSSIIYYMFDSLSLRLEAISGFTLGSFLATEYLDGADDFSERRARFSNPEFGIGIPHDTLLTLGAGVGWAYESFGVQLSIYANRGTRENETEPSILFYPAFGVSAAF